MRYSLSVILFATISSAQSPQKQGYLFDEIGENITQETFKAKIKSGQYTRLIYETNDSIVARLIVREVYGEINASQKNEIISYLKDITGKTVTENQTIIINFSFEKDIPNQRHCLDYYSSVKSYRNYFKRKEKFAQFYIVQQNFKYSKEFVFEDKNDVIRKMLFHYGSDCNYIIIKPDGRYYRQMSEHHQDQIPSKANADW